MTNREFYTAIIKVLNTLDEKYVLDSGTYEGEVPEGESNYWESTVNTVELANFAQSAIEKLDKKNRDRKTKLSPNQKANEDIKTEILNLLATAPQSAKTIVDNIGYNTQKISALVKQLVDNGLVKVDKAKFAGSTTKVNVYALIEHGDEFEESEDEIEGTGDDVE